MRFADQTQTIPKDPNSPGVQVIAAGLWRCATSSLQVAFEQVLQPPLAPSMHGAYCMPYVPRKKILCSAMEEHDTQKRRRMLHTVFDGYNASSDWPGFAFLEDILDMYPDVKVILNKRGSASEWEHSVRASLMYFSTWRYHLLTYWVPVCHWHWKMYRTFARLAKIRYGVDDIFSEECYDRHNQWVRNVMAARGQELLEWEPDDGWSPLCAFLGYALPDEAFPRTNETADIEKLKVALVWQGLRAWAIVLGLTLTGLGLFIAIHRLFLARG